MASNLLGNWHDGIGTGRENSSNREAPNKHEKGSRKYREKIHRDSKFADKYKNLPFKFSKPSKRTKPKEDIFHLCDNCQHISMVSKHRVGQTCGGCNTYVSVNNNNTFYTEESLNFYLNDKNPNDQ